MDEKYTLQEIDELLRNKKERPLSNINVMDYLVIICIVTVIIFVAVNLYFYYSIGVPPTEGLMQYFFAFFGGELLAMAGITISKHRRESKWKDDDEC